MLHSLPAADTVLRWGVLMIWQGGYSAERGVLIMWQGVDTVLSEVT